MLYKAYKYRIYPTKEQAVLIEKTFNCCRFVYNLALETKIYAYKSHGKNLSYFDLSKQLTELTQSNAWLKSVGRRPLEASIKNLNKSFEKFFSGGGYPKFKKKTTSRSFTTRENIYVELNERLLSIGKIKNIPIVLSRKFEGKIKTVTVSKTSTGKYYASILFESLETELLTQSIESNKAIGIDLGLKEFLITSDGVMVSNPRYLRKSIERLKALQCRASKKKKGSNNRRKANLKIALQYERITNRRIDFLHKLSTKLVNDNQVTTFYMETLAVKNLVKNHKLAQAINDVSWSEFCRQMQYKCQWYGKNFIQIGTFEPSSKTCSGCGAIKNITLADRVYNCESCGLELDRDINAAINIKNSGLRKAGESVEALTLVGPKKQKLQYSRSETLVRKLQKVNSDSTHAKCFRTE